jgi:hypothetical protein
MRENVKEKKKRKKMKVKRNIESKMGNACKVGKN